MAVEEEEVEEDVEAEATSKVDAAATKVDVAGTKAVEAAMKAVEAAMRADAEATKADAAAMKVAAAATKVEEEEVAIEEAMIKVKVTALATEVATTVAIVNQTTKKSPIKAEEVMAIMITVAEAKAIIAPRKNGTSQAAKQRKPSSEKTKVQ
jgi:hypothetical protein